jgi:prephenate dehydratase
MPVIVVGTEKNFAALRSRLFTRSVSSKVAGEVSAALQEANPDADLKALAPGTVLFVPDDLPHVSVTGDLSVSGGATSPVADVLAAVEAATGDLVTAVKSRARASAAARKQLAAALSRDEVTVAAKRDKAIGASLDAAQQALAAADAADKESVAAVGQAQSAWVSELEALKAVLPA